MLKKNQNIPIRLLITIAVLLVLIFVMISVHQTLGRYTTSFDGSVVIEVEDRRGVYATYDAPDDISISAQKLYNSGIEIAWEISGNNQISRMKVCNSDGNHIPSENIAVRFRIFIPKEAVAEEGSFTVKVRVLGKEYTMDYIETQSGTAAYTDYGEGYIYNLYNTDRGEICFVLDGGKKSEAEATFTISDKDIDTEKIKVIVETVHLNGGGL